MSTGVAAAGQIDARVEQAIARIEAFGSASSADLEFLDAAVRVVVETLGVPYGKVLELESSSPWLRVVAGVGWEPGTVGQARVPLGSRSQAGLTLRLGGAFVCADLGRSRRFADATLLRRHGIVSGLSVVIGAPERPFGVLSVHTTTRRDFTPTETRFVNRAAAVIATGIHRRRGQHTSA
jgi:GAF domain-containing protein